MIVCLWRHHLLIYLGFLGSSSSSPFFCCPITCIQLIRNNRADGTYGTKYVFTEVKVVATSEIMTRTNYYWNKVLSLFSNNKIGPTVPPCTVLTNSCSLNCSPSSLIQTIIIEAPVRSHDLDLARILMIPYTICPDAMSC